MAAETPFLCPSCRTALNPGVERCGRCGLRLVGADAGRLWQVDQELAALMTERRQLIAHLCRPEPAGGGAAPPSQPPVHVPPPSRSLSAQQILLGLGAILLLAAAAAFLVVVWLVVGLAGQAAIMAALTGAAALSARWATGRHLPAAAEASAVLTSGLVAIDLSAAHALGLAGLDRAPLGWYWAVAAPLAALLLLGADRLVDERRTAGPVRPVLACLPVAAVFATATPWCVLAQLDWTGSRLVAGLGGAAVLDAVVTGACWRWLRRPGTPTWLSPVTPAALGTALATAGYVVSGLVVGYDPTRGTDDRYAAAALLAVAPVLVAVAYVKGIRRQDDARPGTDEQRLAAWLVTAGGVAALGVPSLDLAPAVLDAIAVVAAAGLLSIAWRRTDGGGPDRLGVWTWPLGVTCGAVLVAVYAMVASIRLSGVDTLRHLLLTSTSATAPGPDWRDVALMLVPAVAAAVVATGSAIRRRRDEWVWAAQAGCCVVVFTALLASGSRTWMVVMLAAAAVVTVAAVIGNRRRGSVWPMVEASSVAAWVVYAGAALAAGAAGSSDRAGATLVVLGVLVLGYAACPDRLPFSYGGSVLVSAGVDTWLAAAHVDTVEAYSGPLVALLAGLGLVQHRRARRDRRRLPTTLTAGPALTVAFMPSLLAAIDDGDDLRLAIVSACAVAALVIGLARAWRAPVTVSTLVLVVLAVTQGGPLIGYVPSWVVLGTAGAALLAIGVWWEHAVTAGRRTHAWYATLR